MGSAERFGEDLLNQAKFESGVGCEFEGSGGLGFFHGVAPENCGAAFGRDDAVDGVFLHHHFVGDGDANCASGAAFADDDTDDGDGEFKHFEHGGGNCLGDATGFGFYAGVGGGGVDEGYDGHAESLGHFEHSDCFSVALRFGHGEVSVGAVLNVSAFLVTDDHDGFSIESGGASDDGVVLSEAAIAIEFGEIGEDCGGVIEGVGSGFGSGEENLLPGAEAGVSNLKEVFDALFEFFNAGFEGLAFDGVGFFVGQLFEFGDSIFKVEHGLFPLLPAVSH